MAEALQVKSDPRLMEFGSLLKSEKMQQAMRSVLPKHIPVGKMIRIVIGAMQRSPKLLECTGQSVLAAVMQAATLGLEPDGLLGQGYLVPFWNGKQNRFNCQFVPGYKGLLLLARQSGQITTVFAEVVYKGDRFKYVLGLEPDIQHERGESNEEPSDLTHAYAVAKFKDGSKQFVVLSRKDIDRIKTSSSSRNKNGELIGPWAEPEHEAEMWKKTAVRRLCKLLPLSVEVLERIEMAHAEEEGELLSLEPPAVPDFRGAEANGETHQERADQ